LFAADFGTPRNCAYRFCYEEGGIGVLLRRAAVRIPKRLRFRCLGEIPNAEIALVLSNREAAAESNVPIARLASRVIPRRVSNAKSTIASSSPHFTEAK